MLIVVPARLGSERLPGKVLEEVGGMPMVVQVAKRAQESKAGDVVVACAEQKVADVVRSYGFEAVLTDPALPTGTDRVYAAFKALGSQHQHVVNVQGDMPFIDPQAIRDVADLIARGEVDMATAVVQMDDTEKLARTSVVKVVIDKNNMAIYFSRTPGFPYGKGPHYAHIGIYGYNANSIQRYVELPRSALEIREGLEQLRALEDRMKIGVAFTEHYPQSVDVPDDLQSARQFAQSAEAKRFMHTVA